MSSTEPRHPDASGRLSSDDLSRRELQVVSLITSGHTNREIARELYLSINSVKTYVRTAYRKMGVTRRAEAVVWGMLHGLQGDAAAQALD